MKKAALLIALVAFSVISPAQSYEGNVKYDKKNQQAIVIGYNYPSQAVEDAMVLKMEKMGYKGKVEKGIFNSDKGFIAFKNAYVTEISPDRMDYIIKVERKSRKEDDESILYLVMFKGNENAMIRMDAGSLGKAKLFLNNMLPEIEAANLEIQIREQEEGVAKAEGRLKSLKDDQLSLEKKLEQNKTDQESTQKEIESQKAALEILMGKRKNKDQ